jgi:hypothetical protein
MKLNINQTVKGTVTYPLHSHTEYEIMHYISGEGILRAETGDIPFGPETIVIMPPNLIHGSTSEKGFMNISISGSFNSKLSFKEPIVMLDNEKHEGRLLAEMLYGNRFGNEDFISSLCETYILFLLSNLTIESDIDRAVNGIITEISGKAFRSDFEPCEALIKSGYAEDYIRNRFKAKTGKTPTQFLTDIRIKRACFLIEVYKSSYSLTEISEQCGFTDYIYFSKRFKSITGFSPAEYKKRIKK